MKFILKELGTCHTTEGGMIAVEASFMMMNKNFDDDKPEIKRIHASFVLSFTHLFLPLSF